MSWRDDIYLNGRGSFRGVEFYVGQTTGTFGRRSVTHEFPDRDTPMVEDLGRATRIFTLEAYVLGDDYFSQRDALRIEFEKKGPGPLIHPYWGNLTVTPTGAISIRETPSEGGMARLTIRVVETTDDLQPLQTPDTQEEVEQAITAATESVTDQFLGVEVSEETRAAQFERGDVPDDDAWTITGVIEDTRDRAVELGNAAASKLNTVNGYTNAALSTADQVGDTITNFSDQMETLILAPADLAAGIQGLTQSVLAKIQGYSGIWERYISDAERLVAPAATPEATPTSGTPDTGGRRNDILVKTFNDLQAYGDDFTAIAGTTPQELMAAGNQAAIITLFHSMSLIETCRAVIVIPFGSYDDAVTMRDLLADALDALADTSGDLTWRALVDLRTAVTRHLDSVSADLPRVTEYTPRTTVPALVLAHTLYGDSRQELDLIARNKIRNPLKVPGGVTLEVLSSE